MTLEFNSNVTFGYTPPVVGWRIFGDRAAPVAPHPNAFINMNFGTALRTVEKVLERERAAAGADTGGNK